MIFIKNNNQRKNSKQLRAEHQQRCAKLFATLAFIMLLLLGVMLYLAISSQYSEQKTAYYIVFAFAVIGFLALTGLSIYEFLCVKQQPVPMQHRLSFIHLAPNEQHIRIDDQYLRSQIRFEANH